MAQTPGPLLWEETIPGGCHWSGVVRRGVALRLTDLQGRANCAMLIFNHEERSERYNMPDTLKAQHTAVLGKGHVLYTDMGRALCSIVEDTVGGHDTVCGVMDDATLEARFGQRRYQQYRNEMHRSGKEGLLKELGRVGLGKRDLHASVNWFSRVAADAQGNLRFVPGHSKPGGFVDLRFDMHAFVALSTCMHPLDPQTGWNPKPVKVSAWRCGLAAADDYCRTFRPESERAFINTERYFAQ
jgi:urea carboxylase-associated protein 2